MIRLIFTNPPTAMPSSMADGDGFYSLDLQPQTIVALTKVIDDYIEIGSIKQDTFREIVIPVTKKNSLLFQNVGNPNAINKTNAEIFDIQLLKGDYTYPTQGIQIIDYSDVSNEWSCTLFGDLNEWYKPLSELYLNQLELGSATYSIALFYQQLDTTPYEDGNLPIYSTVVNYGDWFINYNQTDNSNIPAQLVLNDYRYWVSPYALIKQAFCQVGYELIAPIMDTLWFRSLWCYLLDPEFETIEQGNLSNRAFEEAITFNRDFVSLFTISATGKHLIGVVGFKATPDIDPGNHYIWRPWFGLSPTADFYGSFYSGGAIGTYYFDGTIRLTYTGFNSTALVDPNYITWKVSIRKCTLFGINSQQDLIDKSTILATETKIIKGFINSNEVKNFEFSISAEDIKTYKHEVVFCFIETAANLVSSGGVETDQRDLYAMTDLLTGASFRFDPHTQVIEEGDTFDVANFMSRKYTAAELLKGISHLLNLKIETDSSLKQVKMYPEFKIDLFKDGIQEAFFLDNGNNPLELTNKVQVKSMKQSYRNTELNRNVELKFANGSDGYISTLDLDEELHSKYIDLGDEYEEGINELVNPFFAPTANAIDTRLTNFGLSTTDRAVNYIPFLWEDSPQSEGEYPEKGFDFVPRILFAYRPDDLNDNNFVSTYVRPSISGLDEFVRFGVMYEDNFYREHAQPFAQIMPDGVRSYMSAIRDPLEEQQLVETVTYGNTVEPIREDLYQLIYRRAVSQAYFRIALEFLVMIDLYEFKSLSFRRKVHIKYKSAAFGEIDFYARLSRVTDYVIGGNITTPIEVLPDGNNFACEI